MKRAHIYSSLCVAGLLSTGIVAAGCGRSEEPETNASAEAGAAAAGESAQAGMPEHGQDLTVSGCLTASLDGRSYALTPTDTGTTPAGQAMTVPGNSNTITYELVGNAEDFRRHANTMVTARGRSDASAQRQAGVERKDEAEQQPAAGSKDTPVVETKEEVDVNVRRLHVASVVGSGEACPSMGQGTRPSTEAPGATGTTGGAAKGGTTPRPQGRP